MENPILISTLNDFIFCPASIYFHNLYENLKTISYQCSKQINGSHVHKSIDANTYSSKKNVLQSIDVYTEKYGIIGKIDIFDTSNGVLTERKKEVKTIYDGYIFQLYAQYFGLIEMGYDVSTLQLYSYDANKTFNILLPSEDKVMLEKFEKTIDDMKSFDLTSFEQTNISKCANCIYRPYCDRTLAV